MVEPPKKRTDLDFVFFIISISEDKSSTNMYRIESLYLTTLNDVLYKDTKQTT